MARITKNTPGLPRETSTGFRLWFRVALSICYWTWRSPRLGNWSFTQNVGRGHQTKQLSLHRIQMYGDRRLRLHARELWHRHQFSNLSLFGIISGYLREGTPMPHSRWHLYFLRRASRVHGLRQSRLVLWRARKHPPLAGRPLFLGRKTRGHFLGRKRDQIPQDTNHLCKWAYPKRFRNHRTRGTWTR